MKLESAFDPREFKEKGHFLIDLLYDHLVNSLSGNDMRALPWEEPEKQYQYWKAFFNDGSSEIEDFYRRFIDRSIHLHNPCYIGHQVVPPLPLNALTGLVEDVLNNSMAIYEMGPAASAIERLVTEWICGFFYHGNPDASGFLTSGGSLGNLTALLAAKANCNKEGTTDIKNMAVMVSSHAHYSIDRSARIMGIKGANIVLLPVGSDFKINMQQTTEIYNKLLEQNIKVMAFVANACSTATGTYDPLEDIALFCKTHEIWLHVDAAHGGPAILSEKFNHLLKGIENADSIIMDFHKMMLTPALTTAVLFKQNNSSYETFSQKASYLLKEKESLKWYDIAARTIECTKKPMAAKVFISLKLYGKDVFTEYIDKTFGLAMQFAEYLIQRNDFELPVVPESNIICFRYVKPGLKDDDINLLNTKIRKAIIEDGTFYIVQTELNDRVYLRSVIMNPFTTMAILKKLVERIVLLGNG